jgi:hypothetical protein
LGSIVTPGTCDYPPLWSISFNKGDCGCEEELYFCNENITGCDSEIRSLDTWDKLNTCSYFYNQVACPEYDEYYEVGETVVIVCCDALDIIYAISQEALDRRNISTYNGSGPYDCIKVMEEFSPLGQGDYCDRVLLQLWNTVNPSNPYNL